MIKKLILGSYKSEHKLKPAIKNQIKNIKRVWNNDVYKDFGIERVLRLFLVVIQFAFPALYLRQLSGLFGLLGRKIMVEFYVIIKLILPVLFFYLDITNNIIVVIIAIYILLETVIYLTSLIFLSDVYAQPISYKRSVVLLFINYVEVILEFAVIYSYFNINYKIFPGDLVKDIDIIYFSFVSFSPIGFGEIDSILYHGKLIVICQIFVFLIFGGLFLSVFTSNIGKMTYFNSHKEKKWKKK
ncbi:MAG: ion channel [Flavobacteriaceae bacterium]